MAFHWGELWCQSLLLSPTSLHLRLCFLLLAKFVVLPNKQMDIMKTIHLNKYPCVRQAPKQKKIRSILRIRGCKTGN